MKITHEMKVVIKKLFNQYPIAENDEINSDTDFIPFKFKEKIDRSTFLNNFRELNGLDFMLDENSFYIYKRRMPLFMTVINNRYDFLQLESNHRKYERIFNRLVGRVKKIRQVNLSDAIQVEFEDEIDVKLLEQFALVKYHHSVLCDELLIFPAGMDSFNKSIDLLYVQLVEEELRLAASEKLVHREAEGNASSSATTSLSQLFPATFKLNDAMHRVINSLSEERITANDFRLWVPAAAGEIFTQMHADVLIHLLGEKPEMTAREGIEKVSRLSESDLIKRYFTNEKAHTFKRGIN